MSTIVVGTKPINKTVNCLHEFFTYELSVDDCHGNQHTCHYPVHEDRRVSSCYISASGYDQRFNLKLRGSVLV